MNDQVEEGKAKAAGIVAIPIGVIALIELICGFIYLRIGFPDDRDGSGLWSGAGLGVICALGILTWVKKSKTVLVFYLVMCILWFIVCIVQAVIAFIVYRIYHDRRILVETNCDQITEVCRCQDTDGNLFVVFDCDDVKPIESIFLCILIVSVFAAILTLAGSIIGCMGTCCARPAQSSNLVVMQQPAGYPVVMQQTTKTQQEYPAQPYPGQQSYPGQQPVMLAQGGETPPGKDQGDLPPKQEQTTSFYVC